MMHSQKDMLFLKCPHNVDCAKNREMRDEVLASVGRVITRKYTGSIVASFDKSVEPNEELKVEQIFPLVLSTTDTTLRTLNFCFI